jgi:membrane protein
LRSATSIIPDTLRRGWGALRRAQRLAGADRADQVGSAGLRLVVETFREMKRDDAGLIAAGVAYYAVLSLLPLAMALWGVLGLFADSAQVANAIESFFAVYLPGSASNVVDQFRSSDVATSGILGAIGLLSLMWVGSAMFTAVSKAINRAFRISESRPFYLAKPRALALGLGLFALFGISVYSSVVIESLANFDVPVIGELGFVAVVAHLPPLLLTLATFTIAYKMLPNTRTSWRHTLPVAAVGATVFEAAKFGFAIYLSRFANYDQVYGSIASVIVLMVWSYTSAYIVIAGAHVTAVYIRIREGLPSGAPAELNKGN